jgi:hypothetical protein
MSDDLIQRVLEAIATSKRIPLETVTIDSDFAHSDFQSFWGPGSKWIIKQPQAAAQEFRTVTHILLDSAS